MTESLFTTMWSNNQLAPKYRNEPVALRATQPNMHGRAGRALFRLYLMLPAIEGKRERPVCQNIAELHAESFRTKAQAQVYIEALRPVIELRFDVVITEVYYWTYMKGSAR